MLRNGTPEEETVECCHYDLKTSWSPLKEGGRTVLPPNIILTVKYEKWDNVINTLLRP